MTEYNDILQINNIINNTPFILKHDGDKIINITHQLFEERNIYRYLLMSYLKIFKSVNKKYKNQPKLCNDINNDILKYINSIENNLRSTMDKTAELKLIIIKIDSLIKMFNDN